MARKFQIGHCNICTCLFVMPYRTKAQMDVLHLTEPVPGAWITVVA